MTQGVQAGLPMVAEATDSLWEIVVGGQPFLLVRHGKPAAVVVDYGSWQEIEVLVSEDSTASELSRRHDHAEHQADTALRYEPRSALPRLLQLILKVLARPQKCVLE